MSDDIDIEEHDVLDNPRIKSIFPDIASIKTEVIDYEEETSQPDYQEEAIDYEIYRDLNESEHVPIEFETSNVHQNKIILGSKRCTSPIPAEDECLLTIQECSVILEDLTPILDNSPYCKECQTLFPTENALDSHKMLAHSFLIAVNNNKAVKSTSKSSITAINLDSTREVVCNHCNQIFHDENALLKHTYELLPSKFNQSDSKIKIPKASNLYLSCYICSCVFVWQLYLFQHLQRFHDVESDNCPIKTVTNLKCRFCPSHMVNSKAYNAHIYNRHFDMYTLSEVSKAAEQTSSFEKFQCEFCNKVFQSATSLKIHTAIKHETDAKSKIPILAPKPVVGMKSISEYRRPIPKCILFSCNKCQIHFVSCATAVEHSKRCVLTRGDWKCKKCRRSFKMADKNPHLRQHTLSESFRVIKVDNKMLDRVMCRCTLCNICFDERTFFKYHSFSCSEQKSIFCSMCQVDIHEHAYKRHCRLHNEVTQKQNFLIVDYVFYDDEVTTHSRLAKKRKVSPNFLYYCPSCKVYMKVNKICDNHVTGKCNKTLAKCICKLCGLRFSLKSFKSHKETHKNLPNIKLKDMIFRNIQNGQKIDPPFPLFKKCRKCKVCFYSAVALRSHVCNLEEVQVCDYCSEKFSDLAYQLHVPFHQYRNEKKLDAHIPELLKKYESLKTIWNILFLCEICDIVFDAYDDMVEHCQDHYCNMENYNVIINHCEICDLKFGGKYFERHEYLHTANDINKSSFTIINCNYETLLSDSWLNIFEALAFEQVDQILQKSIYKEIRSIRMSVLVDKNTDLVLYKCGVCKMILNSGSIMQHTQDRNNCVTVAKYSCSICHFRFYSNKMLLCHQEIHKNMEVDENSFKIISFNNEIDSYVNDSLKLVPNHEALKFIRCQHCGRLINKSKYSKHVSYHKYMQRKKVKKVHPKIVMRKRKFQNSVITFYRCKKCNVCVFRQNIKIHFCSKNTYKKQCPKCQLWFRVSHMHKHDKVHENYNFSKNNVKVINFKDGEVEVEDLNKTILHQCNACGVCIHKKANIIKHKCCESRFHKLCKLCEVPFRFSHFYMHQQIHRNKIFTKKNLIISKFNPPVKGKLQPVAPVQFNGNAAAKSLTITSAKLPKSSSQIVVEGNKVNRELSTKSFLKHISYRYFRCDKCQVYFVTGSALAEHTKCCRRTEGTDSTDAVTCWCGIAFHTSAIDIHQAYQRCGNFALAKVYVVTLISDNKGDFDVNKCLYTCKTCDHYYLALNTVINHLEENHFPLKDTVECDKCNLSFSGISNVKHNNLHHKQNKWSISDLYRFEVDTMTLREAIDLSVISRMPFNRLNSIEEKKAVKRKVVAPEPVLAKKALKTESEVLENQTPCSGEIYTCDICHLNFVHKASLKSHYQLGDHNKQSVNCKKCGLAFTLHSLSRHMSKTRDDPNERRINSHTDTSTRNDSLNDSQSSDIICSNVYKMENMKLFKCGECDVYFLTLEVCSDHMKNHQTLDPTEYIACKICELQFLCENLGFHMKSHRNGSFNMDDLIVTELRANKHTVDTYLALDRLKSKAVSTTTHSDNDDDKIVHSTSVDS